MTCEQLQGPGIHPAYIQRTTEPLEESMDEIKCKVDLFVDGRASSDSDGLAHIAHLLAVWPDVLA